MKRILAIFLTIAMIGVVMGGCGSKEEAGTTGGDAKTPPAEGEAK